MTKDVSVVTQTQRVLGTGARGDVTRPWLSVKQLEEESAVEAQEFVDVPPESTVEAPTDLPAKGQK